MKRDGRDMSKKQQQAERHGDEKKRNKQVSNLVLTEREGFPK